MNNNELYRNIMQGISKALFEDFEITTDGYRRFGKKFENEHDELRRLQKKVVDKKNGKKEVYYRFGKNGMGLTTEFMAIGDDIYNLSKKYYIYLDNQAYFDEADDVYDIMVHCIPREKINEGAWGYTPHESDTYWDHTHVVCDGLLKQLIEVLAAKKKKPSDNLTYSYMGLVNGFLKADEVWHEVIFSKGIELYQAYEKAFDRLDADKENHQGWKDFKKYKKELKKTFDEFKSIMKDKYDFEIAKALKEKNAKKKKPKMLKSVNENLGFKPFDMPCYHGQDWEVPDFASDCIGTTKDLENGIYKAMYYAHVFELENGDKYYTPCGVRRPKRFTSWEDYCIYDGQVREKKYCEMDDECKIPGFAEKNYIGTVNNLADGIYKALYYANTFELENGDKYYAPIGVLRSRELTRIEAYYIEDGKISELFD